MEVLHDKKWMIRYQYNSTQHFRNPQIDTEGVPCGVLATAKEILEESVRLVCQSKALFALNEVDKKPFREFLNS